MPQFLIRPACVADAAAIDQIHTSSLHVAELHPAAPAARLPFWRSAINYGEPQLHLACDGATVAGVVGFDRSRDKGTPPTMGEIWTIQVLATYQGQGAGLALWDTAREELLEEGCTDVMVWINPGNDRAMRFHELAGFKRVMSSARTTLVHGVRTELIRLRRKL